MTIASERALYLTDNYVPTHNSTKSGKTIGCIIWLLERAVEEGRPGRTFWWVAPVYNQARIAFNRMLLGTRHWNGLVVSFNKTALTLTIYNGATIEFRSAENPDNLYGENVFAAVLDEDTRMREDAWTAVRSTLTATNGPARLIGNVKGKRNWAYKIARRVQLNEMPDWHYARITVQDAVAENVIKQSEVEAARQELPEQVFRELYEAEASDDEGNPFGLEHIAHCLRPRLSTAAPDVMGWDLGKRADYAVGIGLDDASQMCRFIRFKQDWERVHNEIGANARGPRKVLIDSTGVGDPILERAQREFGIHIEGYTWSAASKQRLMEGLALAIQQERIVIYDDPEGLVRGELEAFEYEYTRTGVRYAAPPGFHDDIVASLAMAVAAQGPGASRLWDIEPDEYEDRHDPLGKPDFSREDEARVRDFVTGDDGPAFEERGWTFGR